MRVVVYVVCVVVCVVVYTGQTCGGALLRQGPTSVLRHTFPSRVPREPGGPETQRGSEGNDLFALTKYLRTGVKSKDMTYRTLGETSVRRSPMAQTAIQTALHTSQDRRARQPPSLPLSITASKPSAIPHLNLSLAEAETRGEGEGRRYPVRHLQPWISRVDPIEMPVVTPCKTPRLGTPAIATAPPNVCDLCPDEDGKNPLDPCTCVGVGGSSTGLISISCPSNIVSLDQLQYIFGNTNFLVTHIFQFSLQGSSADGALTRDIWGDLDFKYVSINNNRITDVDNGAFIGSSNSLIGLNLANNNIKNYIAVYNDLPNLLSLNLRGNNISLIFSEDFRYPSLTDLDLSYNEITSIGTRSFAALKKLKSLNLSYNQLSSIGDERFTFIDHDYSNVLVINLSFNNISSISSTAFLGLKNVEIDFSFNQLHTLDKTIFYPIIRNSQYYAYFHFIGNKMVCDCALLWVLQDGNARLCFDNFSCTNNNKSLYSLTIADLGNCTQSEPVRLS